MNDEHPNIEIQDQDIGDGLREQENGIQIRNEICRQLSVE